MRDPPDTWKPIYKGGYRNFLTLKIEITRKGHKRYRLCIPMRLRKRSEFCKHPGIIYCNLLQKGPLVMVQFIPSSSITEESYKIQFGQIYLAKNVLGFPGTHACRLEVPHRIDGGNIIIDREALKNAKELK